MIGSALDICVTWVSSLGVVELGNEGEYGERLRMSARTKLLEARWSNELFGDRATLTSRSILKQVEQRYSEQVRGMSLRERKMHRLLLKHLRILLPASGRLPLKPMASPPLQLARQGMQTMRVTP